MHNHSQKQITDRYKLCVLQINQNQNKIFTVILWEVAFNLFISFQIVNYIPYFKICKWQRWQN